MKTNSDMSPVFPVETMDELEAADETYHSAVDTLHSVNKQFEPEDEFESALKAIRLKRKALIEASHKHSLALIHYLEKSKLVSTSPSSSSTTPSSSSTTPPTTPTTPPTPEDIIVGGRPGEHYWLKCRIATHETDGFLVAVTSITGKEYTAYASRSTVMLDVSCPRLHVRLNQRSSAQPGVLWVTLPSPPPSRSYSLVCDNRETIPVYEANVLVVKIITAVGGDERREA